jgi:hypothetical protein
MTYVSPSSENDGEKSIRFFKNLSYSIIILYGQEAEIAILNIAAIISIAKSLRFRIYAFQKFLRYFSFSKKSFFCLYIIINYMQCFTAETT